MFDRNEATHDPSATRLRTAEQAGRFARSRDFSVAIIWLAGISMLLLTGGQLWGLLQQVADRSWSNFDSAVSVREQLTSNWTMALHVLQHGLLPILAVVAFVAAGVWWIQSGFRFFPNLAAPQLARIHPSKNLTRIFEAENQLGIFIGLVRFAGLMVVACWVLFEEKDSIIRMGQGDLARQCQHAFRWIVSVTQRLCIAAILVGIIDYGIRWRLNRRSQMMTDQEMREEQKAMEPAVEVTARRRLMGTQGDTD